MDKWKTCIYIAQGVWKSLPTESDMSTDWQMGMAHEEAWLRYDVLLTHSHCI